MFSHFTVDIHICDDMLRHGIVVDKHLMTVSGEGVQQVPFYSPNTPNAIPFWICNMLQDHRSFSAGSPIFGDRLLSGRQTSYDRLG